MTDNVLGFDCSYYSPDGDRCAMHDAQGDSVIEAGQPRDNRCIPDECPLLQDLMLGGDLFSG